MSKAKSTIHQVQRPSASIEIVGTKSHGELAADWLRDFQKNATPRGRPKNGFTSEEMAKAAGTNRQAIERYIRNNQKRYQAIRGTMTHSCGERHCTYYVFIK